MFTNIPENYLKKKDLAIGMRPLNYDCVLLCRCHLHQCNVSHKSPWSDIIFNTTDPHKKQVLRLKLLLFMLHRELIKAGVLLSVKKNTWNEKKYSLHKKFFFLLKTACRFHFTQHDLMAGQLRLKTRWVVTVKQSEHGSQGSVYSTWPASTVSRVLWASWICCCSLCFMPSFWAFFSMSCMSLMAAR